MKLVHLATVRGYQLVVGEGAWGGNTSTAHLTCIELDRPICEFTSYLYSSRGLTDPKGDKNKSKMVKLETKLKAS